MNKKSGFAVFTILALQITMVAMVVVSQIPIVKNGHRTNKAELVCQGQMAGHTSEYDKYGNKTASLVDVVNADVEGYMQNVPEYVVDYCHDEVAKLSKEEQLEMIQDK